MPKASQALLTACIVAASAVAGLASCAAPIVGPQYGTPELRVAARHVPPPAPPLLYVSDQSTGNVYVWNWNTLVAIPGDDIIGTFSAPYGQCVDTHGDIFISDFGTGSTLAFHRGAVMPYHTYSYPGTGSGAAIGCSVDHIGDVAVSYYSTSANVGAPQGEVAVWYHGTGTPYQYTSTSCYSLWQPGFDSADNLIVQGETSVSVPAICELPAGGTSLMTVTLSGGVINSPGSVMWDGHYVALTDQKVTPFKTGIYRATLSGTTLTVVGTPTILKDGCVVPHHDSLVVQPFIVGTKIVGGDLTCAAKVAVWHYTAGLGPFNQAPGPPVLPYGQSVSFP